MSGRRRALVLGVAGVICGVAAASTASSQANRYRESFGPLRDVVVVRRDLPAMKTLGEEATASRLSVRRVPSAFVPPGTLRRPIEAMGLAPARRVPAGAYLQVDRLRPPGREGRRPGVEPGRVPVELAVAGAGALADLPPGAEVDVLVVVERDDGRVRTEIAERQASLIELVPAGAKTGSGGTDGTGLWAATLSVRRERGPALIEAHANAREARLLASGRDGP